MMRVSPFGKALGMYSRKCLTCDIEFLYFSAYPFATRFKNGTSGWDISTNFVVDNRLEAPGEVQELIPFFMELHTFSVVFHFGEHALGKSEDGFISTVSELQGSDSDIRIWNKIEFRHFRRTPEGSLTFGHLLKANSTERQGSASIGFTGVQTLIPTLSTPTSNPVMSTTLPGCVR